MKALSLTQPWASLVAIGVKRIETRSWKQDYRGRIAIHAAKKFPQDARMLTVCDPFLIYLYHAGLTAATMPLGAVIATATLTDIVTITTETRPLEPEASFGDYTPGRYAWHLADIRPLPTPIPARGELGLWDWDVPAELKHLEVS